MQTSTVINFRPLATGTGTDASDCSDAFGAMPELPRPSQRWTVRRKAAVIEAVRGGWVSIDEICELYNVSVDEFLAWERDIDRYGIHGLRTTRYQIYRDSGRSDLDHARTMTQNLALMPASLYRN